MTEVWEKEEDNRLRVLFESPKSRRGFDSEDVTKLNIEKILGKKHFSTQISHFGSFIVEKYLSVY